MSSSTNEIYLEFDNLSVRVVATRNIPEIKTPGLRIEKIEEGTEFSTKLWLTLELIESGLARLVDDVINGEEWTQIHYRERFQPLRKPLSLPNSFYSRVNLTFKEGSKLFKENSSRLDYINQIKGRFRDILESRIGKVVRLASSEATADTKTLQPEEATLYNELRDIISLWRKKMRKLSE